MSERRSGVRYHRGIVVATASIPGETMLAGSAVIELRGLVRTYGGAGGTRALDGLSMAVPEGSIFGLLGNNGAGKTTAIRILLGLIPADAGTATVLGLDSATGRAGILERVGFFSENDDPYEWMRLTQLFDVARCAFPTWDEARCVDLCARFELDRAKRVRELSKGMLAKTKLVMAMAHRPRCLVLDEPTSGLDPGSQRELLEAIKQLSRGEGTTVVFSSHNLADVSAIATEIAILHAGRLAFESPMADVRDGCAIVAVTEAVGAAPLDAVAWERRSGGPGEAGSPGETRFLVRDRRSPGVQAFVERHPSVRLTAAPLEEVFHLVTRGQRPTGAGGGRA